MDIAGTPPKKNVFALVADQPVQVPVHVEEGVASDVMQGVCVCLFFLSFFLSFV